MALPSPVHHKNWLTAIDCDTPEGEVLIVYRSTLVRDADPIYQPIAEHLNTHNHRVLYSDLIPDENMMFGQAVLTLYQIGDKT